MAEQDDPFYAAAGEISKTGLDAREGLGEGTRVLRKLHVWAEDRHRQRKGMPPGIGQIRTQGVEKARGRMHSAAVQENQPPRLRGVAAAARRVAGV